MAKSKASKTNNNNKQNNKMPKQVLVVNGNPTLQAKNQKSGNVIARVSQYSQSDTAKYAKALLNPFSEDAGGARVPDQFYAPTATFAFREFASVANNTSGTADIIFLPSIIQPCFSTRGSITNGVSLGYRDTTTVANGTILGSSSALMSKVTNHRIVSWGIRIRNTSAVTNAQGIITIALFNPADSAILPSPYTVGGQTGQASGLVSGSLTADQYLKSLGLPNTGTLLDVAALTDFPCHMRSQASQLSEKTFQIVPKLISPRALEFRQSGDTGYGTDIVYQTSLAFIQAGSSSYIRCDGWTGIAIGYSGGSATAGANTFDIEMVYNVEGAPNVSSGTVFTASSAKSYCDPIGMLNAQSKADLANAFVEVTTGAMSAYRQFSGY